MPQIAFQDYGYSNARVRALKQSLLGKEFYEKVISMDSFAEIVGALANTPYQKEIEECVMGNGGPTGVDEALKRNITRVFRRIRTYVNKEAEELLSLILARWDLHNIKTVLRGKHIQAPEEEITASLVPVGELDEILLLELAKQPDVRASVDLLATWNIPYARPLTESMPDYVEEKNLTLLELALDKYYYTRALELTKKRSSNRSLIQRLILTQIDISNIITLLRLQGVDFNRLKQEMIEAEKTRREEEQMLVSEESVSGEQEEQTEKEAEETKEQESEEVEGEEAEKELPEEQLEEIERAKGVQELGKEVAGEEEKEVKKGLLTGIKQGVASLRKSTAYWWEERKKERLGRKEARKREKKGVGKRLAQEVKDFFTLPERSVWLTRRRRARTRKEKREVTQEAIDKIVDQYVEDLVLDFYIPGGEVIDQKMFFEIAQRDDAVDVIDSLKDTSYGPVLEKVSKRYLETAQVSLIERAMEELLIRKAISAYNVGPLSFGVILSYVWAKYNEVVNLRIVVRGKSVGMPERNIREDLVLI